MLSQSRLSLPVPSIGPSGVGGPGSLMLQLASEADFLRVPEDIQGDKPTQDVVMLPPEIEMSEAQEQRLADYLKDEIQRCTWERQAEMDKLARLREKIKTKFPEIPKDWPIANAAQVTVPIIKIAAETLTSRVFQTVMAAKPLASIRTKNPDYQDFVNTYEEFLDLYDEEYLDMEDVLDTSVTESINLGTAVLETTTCRERRKLAYYDPTTQRYELKNTELYNGPVVYHIPIDDFWIRPVWSDVDKAPWCGKALHLNWSQIKDMANSGELNPDCLESFYMQTEMPQSGTTPVQDKEREMAKVPPANWEKFRIFELFVRWDVDGDGLDEEILVYYCWETNKLLRRKFNTFKRGHRPFTVLRHKRTPHWFYGEGMAEALEQLQDEISTIHRQRLDNATINNLHIILVTKTIQGLRPGDRLWTGKVVRVQDIKDVSTLKLGETYSSTVENERTALNYAQMLSGIGETASGQAQPVSRTTATAQLALLEELNRRFDKTVKGYRKGIKAIHNQITDLLAEYGTNGLAEEWFGDRGVTMEQTLTDPATFKGGRVKVLITSTKSTINREVEFQSAIAVLNLIVQTGTQILGLTQRLAPQAEAVVAHELVRALKEPWRKVMQYSDSGDVDQALSVLAVLERVLPPPESLGGVPGQPAPGAVVGAGPGGADAGGGGQQSNGLGAPTLAGPGSMEVLMQSLGRGGRPMPELGPQR